MNSSFLSLLLVFTILLPLIAILYHSYLRTHDLLTGLFQSFIVASGGIILLNTLLEGSTFDTDVYKVPAHLAGSIAISLFTYRAFIYSDKFDRMYPEDTIKLWKSVDPEYLRAMVDQGFDGISTGHAFTIEIHGVKEKWFCVYENKNKFSQKLLNNQKEPTQCWNCGKVKDDIRLEGLRINPYAMKNNVFDSRSLDAGIGHGSICYDCSMSLVKEINDGDEMDIDNSDLVVAGI